MKKRFMLNKRLITAVAIIGIFTMLYFSYACYVAIEDVSYKPQKKTTVINMREYHQENEYTPREGGLAYAYKSHFYGFLVDNPPEGEWERFMLGLSIYKQYVVPNPEDNLSVWLGREGKVYYSDTPKYSNFPFYEAIITRNFKPFAVYGVRERYRDANLWDDAEGAIPDVIIKIDDIHLGHSCYHEFSFETYRSVLDFEWKTPEKLKSFLQSKDIWDDPGINYYRCTYKLKNCTPNESDKPPVRFLPCNGLNEMDVDSSNIVMQ